MDNTQQLQTAQARPPRPVDTLKGILDAPSVRQQFRNAMGDHADEFTAGLIDLFGDDRQLAAVPPEQRRDVYGGFVRESLRAAVLRLPLTKGLGFAYIVCYRNSRQMADGTWGKVVTPTFVLGYKGYIQLAMRSGQYRVINCDVVYEGELRGRDKLTGAVDLTGERVSDKVVGYFAHFELLNGFSKTLYMGVREMAEYAKRYSPSVGRQTTAEALAALAGEGGGKSVGWEGCFDDMALKTCLRRLLSKYGILSIEMQTALSGEARAEEAERDAAAAGMGDAEAVDVEEASYEEVRPAEAAPSPAPTSAMEPDF